jgi:hypothetical protein
MNNVHSFDEVGQLFDLNQALETPEAECFEGLVMLVLESDEIGEEEIFKIERTIRLYGGVSTKDFGLLK